MTTPPQTPNPCRLAICFGRFGPYHLARLNAAAKVFPRLIGLEWSSHDPVYAWDQPERDVAFDWRTATEAEDPEKLPQTVLLESLDRLFLDSPPDCIAVNGWGYPTARAATKWARKRRIPVIVMSESTAWDSPRVWWREWIKRMLIRQFSAALVGGTAHRDYLIKLGMPAERIAIGYDVVDNHHFAQGAAQARQNAQQLRQKWGLERPFFLASARFISIKNVDRLITAYSEYSEQVLPAKRWDLVLLGDGELRDELEKHTVNCGLGVRALDRDTKGTDDRPAGNGTVHFAGFRQYHELPLFYGLASVFVHPSLVEPWGLVVNEALASGLPCIVSNRCGCATDLIKPGENGHTFDPRSIRSLASHLAEYAQMNQIQLEVFGKNAIKASDNYCEKQFAIGIDDAVSIAGFVA